MYPSYLSNYIIKESQTSLGALWKLQKQWQFQVSPILVVLNDSNEYVGIITPGALDSKIMHLDDPVSLSARAVCNSDARVLTQGVNNRTDAMEVFADNDKIWAVPVIDDRNYLSDIIFRQQVFWLDFYKGMNRHGTLPLMHYASQIYRAAQLAKDLGYGSFSVIEFGVAGGNGLIACEFHIKEIARLFDLEIELYGFDTGEGMPKPTDYRDVPYMWDKGFYLMDLEKLRKRLQFAKLVIGDLRQTASDFMLKADFAPIGVMLVDVDLYSSTVPILNMLNDATSASRFLPRVNMYFDDIGSYLEHIGEFLAVEEFNASSQNVKISRLLGKAQTSPISHHMFCAHFFKHEKYNVCLYESVQLPLL
jgi:hypothetical protein